MTLRIPKSLRLPGLAAALVMALPWTVAANETMESGNLNRYATPASAKYLGELYRRADLDLQLFVNEMYAIRDRFETRYAKSELRAPVIGRLASKEFRDLREWSSELRRNADAHRNNAKYAGQIDDWQEKLERWAKFNLRLGMRRLWLMKISETWFEFGRIEAAAKEPGADRVALRAELESALDDLADWRARLARRSWDWVYFIEDAYGAKAAETFRRLTYEAFAWRLGERLKDEDDPIRGRFDLAQSDLDWLVLHISDKDGETMKLLAEGRALDDPALAGVRAMEERFADVPVERFGEREAAQ